MLYSILSARNNMLFENKSLCGKHAKEIVCSENNKVFKAYNRQNHLVYKFKIDGDVLPSSDSGNRCDYLVEDETKKRAYLIELKRTQLLYALEQIDSTIVRFRSILKGYDLFPRIVYHGNTHDIHGNTYRKFKTKYPTTRSETDYMEEVLK